MRDAPRTRKSWWRRTWHAGIRMVRGAIMLEDSPERIARGCGIGIFCSVLPVLGQTLVAIVLTRLAGGNVIAAIPWSWISNPFTTVPIWYACYRFGALLIPGNNPLNWSQVAGIFTKLHEATWKEAFTHGFDLFGAIAAPILLGTILVGLFFGTIGYILIRRTVPMIQARRSAKRTRWATTTRPVAQSDGS